MLGELFIKEDKRLLASAEKTINVLSKIHLQGCEEGNISSETLDAIATGCEILEAKRDEMEDEYLEDLEKDLFDEIDFAIDKIEEKCLSKFGGTKIPEGYGNRAGFDNAKMELAEKLAKLLLEEMLY